MTAFIIINRYLRKARQPGALPEITVEMVAAEVRGSLVGPPDFKSGVPSDEGGRWVRFPCTSAKFVNYSNNTGEGVRTLKGAAALVTIKQMVRQA